MSIACCCFVFVDFFLSFFCIVLHYRRCLFFTAVFSFVRKGNHRINILHTSAEIQLTSYRPEESRKNLFVIRSKSISDLVDRHLLTVYCDFYSALLLLPLVSELRFLTTFHHGDPGVIPPKPLFTFLRFRSTQFMEYKCSPHSCL